MEVEADIGTEQLKDEPLFGVLDLLLIAALFGTAAWWLLKDRKKENVYKSYTIQ